jgi:phosphatidylserine/phosphatidylglycerophosphate/cardiolipin synthase-like enzyme
MVFLAGAIVVMTVSAVLLWMRFPGEPDVEVYFSPGGGAREAVIASIQSSTGSVYVAMFYMSSADIVQALCEAKLRGVEVVAVFDDSQRRSFRYLQYGISMRLHGIPVRYGFPDKGKMHSKFAVIDGSAVLSGSYNWTESAENFNTEDMTIMRSPKTAALYEEQFARIWHESDNP